MRHKKIGFFKTLVSVPLILFMSACLEQPSEDKESAGGSGGDQSRNGITVAAPTWTQVLPSARSNINDITLQGSATIGTTVGLYTNPTCTSRLQTTTADISGHFTFRTSVTNNSVSTFYANASLSGSASACSTGITFTEDSTAPNQPILTGSTPTSPSSVNNFTLSGTAEANSIVTIFNSVNCSGTPLATGTTNTSGNFSLALTVLDNTSTTFYARATDAASNASACSSTSVTYIENSTPPSNPQLLTFSPLSQRNNNSPHLSGTTTPRVSVNVFTDALCSSGTPTTGLSDANGNFDISLSVADDTTTNFYVQATNTAGKSDCVGPNVYVEDSTAPATPTVRASTPNSPSDNNAPTISGVAEADSSITIFSDPTCATTMGSTTTNSLGNWSYTSSSLADNSTTTFYAKSTDASSNSSNCSTTFVSYNVYSIPEGVAYLTATQTTNSTNLNQVTAYPLSWSTARYHSTYYSYSSVTNPEKLVIASAGDYLVSITIPLSGAVTRARVQANIRVNGINKDFGQVSHGLITNSGGHDTSSLQLTVLLNGLAVNDSIDVTTKLLNGAGIVTTPQATLFVQNIPSNRDIFSATATRTVGSTDINTNVSAFQWTDVVKDANYTHSNSSNTENIILGSNGNYLMFFNFPTNDNNPNRDNNQRVRILKSGVMIPGGEAKQGIIVGTGSDTNSSLTWSGLMYNAAATNIVTVDSAAEANNNPVVVATNMKGHLYIEKLPDAVDTYSGRGTTLTTNSNYNSAAQSLQFSTDDIIDTSTFTHTTSSNSQNIKVLKAGDYQLTLNTSVVAVPTFSDGNFTTTVKVNGLAVTGASSSTHYISNTNGHTESSGTLHFLLRNLAANDVITIGAAQEAANGTMLQNTSHILFMRKLTNSASP